MISVPDMAGGILAAMSDCGIERLWFVSGSELTAYQEGIARAQAEGLAAPKLMTMIHEHVALCAAQGETMVTRSPSSTISHADLGLLHYGGAIHNGLRGGYPVLMMSGYPATTRVRRTVPVFWHQQRWDQGEIVRQYVKWDHKMAPYDDPFIVIGRAIQIALSAPRGPAYLAIPSEVGFGSYERASATRAADLGTLAMGAGDTGGIGEIAQHLLEAHRPLIITDRIGNKPEAVHLLDELTHEFGIGVRATLHRMNLRDDHPSRFSGISTSDADAILVLEHPVPWIPSSDEPGGDAWIAVVGEDPLAAQIPIYEFRADCRLVADPARFLAVLLEEMRRQRKRDHVSRRDERWSTYEDNLAKELSRRRAVLKDRNSLVSPAILAMALDEVIDIDDVLVWEMAELESVARSRPGTLFESGGSHLGWAVGAGIGARVTDPSRPVVCVTGDGSYTFGSPSALLWGQMKHEAPVMTVICNNRGYRTGTLTLANDYPDGFAIKRVEDSGGMFDPPPDYAAHAESAGAFGRKVTRRTELVETLREARKAVESEGRPAVVDVWLPAHVTGKHPLSAT